MFIEAVPHNQRNMESHLGLSVAQTLTHEMVLYLWPKIIDSFDQIYVDNTV